MIQIFPKIILKILIRMNQYQILLQFKKINKMIYFLIKKKTINIMMLINHLTIIKIQITITKNKMT